MMVKAIVFGTNHSKLNSDSALKQKVKGFLALRASLD